MQKTEIFDRVCLEAPIKEAVFDLYMKSVVLQIIASHDEKYAKTEGEIPLRDEYEDALVWGILYDHTKKAEYGAAYHASLEQAYRCVWREIEKKRRKGA